MKSRGRGLSRNMQPQALNRFHLVCTNNKQLSTSLTRTLGMAMPPQYHAPTQTERESLELAGGTVIIGRGMFV